MSPYEWKILEFDDKNLNKQKQIMFKYIWLLSLEVCFMVYWQYISH